MPDRDWLQHETDFLHSSEDLRTFAQHKNIPYDTLRRHAGTGRWIDKRAEQQHTIATNATQLYIEKSAETLAETLEERNAQALAFSGLLWRMASEQVQSCENARELRALALCGESAQKIDRIALSADSSDAEASTDFQIIMDPCLLDPETTRAQFVARGIPPLSLRAAQEHLADVLSEAKGAHYWPETEEGKRDIAAREAKWKKTWPSYSQPDPHDG